MTTVILVREVVIWLRYRIGAVEEVGLQANNGGRLHATVAENEVAGLLVQVVSGPSPTSGTAGDGGGVLALSGKTGRGRAIASRASTNVAIARQNHLRIAVAGNITINEITDFGSSAHRSRSHGGSAKQILRSEVGGVVVVDTVGGTINNFRRAQFVGHDHKTSIWIVRRGISAAVIDVLAGTAASRADSHRGLVAVITTPDTESQTDLLEVVSAADFLGLLLGGSECRQEHGRQNRDNRDDDEQFNKRKCFFLLVFHIIELFLRCCVFLFGGQAVNPIEIVPTVNRISKSSLAMRVPKDILPGKARNPNESALVNLVFSKQSA